MKRRGIVLLALIMTLALLASLFSIPVAGAEEPVNYAAQQSYWKTDSIGYAATSFSEDGMKMTAQETAMAFNQKVKADSKIKFVFEGHGNREGWGGMYIMLKADDGVPYDAPKEPALTKKDTSTGNWLAFAFGASWSTYFIESDDGAVQLTEKAEVSGYDTWYFKAQTTTVEIETKDTDSGVDMSVTFFASGDESNTGIAQTVTYSSDNMALQGDYSVVVGGYVELYEGQDITLATMEASLAETETPVAEAENLAVSSDYWKSGVSSVCFQFGADGIGFYDTQFGAMVSNQTIAADATISFDIAGTLTNGQYGNFYLVFKNEKKSYTFKESIVPVEEGNWCALMFGGDGLKIYDCKDGKVQTVVYGTTVAEGGVIADNADLWFWYKQNTRVSVALSDSETGVRAQIKISGPSGKTTVFDYDCENPALQGESYMSFGMFLSAAGTSAQHVQVNSVMASNIGKGEAYIPDIDVSDLHARAESALAGAISSANVEQVKALIAELQDAQTEMNYTQEKEFKAEYIEQLEKKVAAYETEGEAVAAVEKLIAELPESITVANYEAAKEAIAAARNAYNALTEEGKALVTSLNVLTAAEEALTEYEESLTPDQDQDQEPDQDQDQDPDKPSGCAGIAVGSFGVLALASLVIAVFAMRKKSI